VIRAAVAEEVPRLAEDSLHLAAARLAVAEALRLVVVEGVSRFLLTQSVPAQSGVTMSAGIRSSEICDGQDSSHTG